MEDVRVVVEFHFLASWHSCTDDFKGIPLNVIQLSWHSICTPLGLAQQ